LERAARVIEVLAAAAQKRIKLADIATRMEKEKAVVNATVAAFKPRI
jgi:DNA-binding IclR family transcriptional regulator